MSGRKLEAAKTVAVKTSEWTTSAVSSKKKDELLTLNSERATLYLLYTDKN